MNKSLVWHTEQRQLKDLMPFPNNPRRLTEKQHTDLKKSLDKFNLVEIPAIDLDGTIISGNQRLKILAEINGKEKIDVRVPNRKLTESERKEYNIRANKNTGEFDFEILANEFELTDLSEWGFQNWELGIGEANDMDKEMIGVPEFNQEKVSGYKELNIKFLTEQDYNNFAKLIKRKLTEDTKYIWYPEQDFDSYNRNKIYK